MTIRRSTPHDIPEMLNIFATARRFMAQTGNPNQWAEDYPSVALLTEDINNGDSFICMEDGTLQNDSH